MKVLLDTHVWLWYLLGDQRLTASHLAIIQDRTVELWLSAISVWEAHMLIENRRLPVSSPAHVWVPTALRTMPVRESALTFSIAQRSRAIALLHGDPADRFIAATAIEHKMPLLTCDEKLLACPEIPKPA